MYSYIPGNLTYSFFKVTNATFCSIGIDQKFEHLITDLKLRFFQSVLSDLFWNQVTFGDLQFLLNSITVNFNYLHTVAQGRLNGSKIVAGCNEHHFAEVVIEF